jgi:uncharacterized protein
MSRSIIVVHGGDSFDTYQNYLESLRVSPVRFKDGFVSWKSTLQDQLGESYRVLQPEFPNKHSAQYVEWKIVFEKLLHEINEQTILIGHSLGGLFLTQYLANHSLNIAQLHLVATCYGKEGGFISPKDFSSIQAGCSSIHIWHSVDDIIVPYDHALQLKKFLPTSELHQFVGKGHFNQSDFPELVTAIINS